VLDQAIERRPSDSRLYRERALLKRECGNLDAARHDFERAISHPTGSSSQELADDHVWLGQLAHHDGDNAAALAWFDKALRVQPDFAPAYRQRADALLALDEFGKAGEALDNYFNLQNRLPNRPSLSADYVTRGLIHHGLHQYPEAVEAYSRALRLKRDAETLTYRGWAYLEYDAIRSALADFVEALRLDGTNMDALCGRGYAQMRLGDVAAGLSSFQDALRLDRANASALIGRGQARVQLGEVATGVMDVEAALRLEPANQRQILAAARTYALAVGRVESTQRSQ
jgi:tetratricopeptide (TPR) repeat protein